MNQYSQIFESAFKEGVSFSEDSDPIIGKWLLPPKSGCPCEDCVEKNFFSDDVYVVIQGHTEHLGEILANYRGYKNVVWALDDTSSMREYGLLHDSRINPVIVRRPSNPGFGNINLQSVSTVAGLKHAKNLGAKYCIKIRSDMVFSPLHKFINNVDFSKLGFLSYVTHAYESFEKPMETVAEYIKNFVALHKIKDSTNITRNYVMDFCVTGPVDDLISFFDYTELPKATKIAEGGKLVPSSAEYKYLLNYLWKNAYKMDTRKEYLKELFNFFLPVLEKHKIDLVSLKYNYMNYAHLRKKTPNWHMGA